MNLPHCLRAVMFDLDGTLLYTIEDLTDAINAALAKRDLPTYSVKEITQKVGHGMRRLVADVLPPDASAALRDEVLKDFMDHYRAHCTDKTKPYDGIPALLAALRAHGVQCFVISNKSESETKVIVEKLFGSDVFCGVYGTVDGRPTKPAPDSTLLALSQAGCKREEAVFVGDSDVDLQTGTAAGLYVLSATWGFRSREQLLAAGAYDFVATPHNLENRLVPLCKEKG